MKYPIVSLHAAKYLFKIKFLLQVKIFTQTMFQKDKHVKDKDNKMSVSGEMSYLKWCV